MSERYTPRVGDKVRARLGESVIVGEVVTIASHELMDIALGNPRDSVVRVFEVDGWQFEQIISVPSKRLAIIRRADGAVFMRHSTDATYPWSDVDYWVARPVDEATAGGFSVLFDGVDE